MIITPLKKSMERKGKEEWCYNQRGRFLVGDWERKV